MKRRIAPIGFTLIELLVVIAIIAIIAAILFPVFASAREKARQATCQSNEKQIGLAFLQYVQDFDERYPYAYNNLQSGGVLRGWDQEIAAYMAMKVTSSSNPLVFTCPDDIYARTTAGTLPRTYAMPRRGGTSDLDLARETCDINTGQPLATGNGFSPGRLTSEVLAADSTLMIVEAPLSNNTFGTNNTDVVGHPLATSATDTTCQQVLSTATGADGGATSPIHSGGWNYMFCDGHVKWLQPQQTIGKGLATTPGKGVDDIGASYTCTMTQPCGMWTLNPDD